MSILHPRARTRQVGDYDSFTERSRLSCECRRRLTCTGRRLRESSRHGISPGPSRSVPVPLPAGSGLRRPGGDKVRLSTAAVRASGGSSSTFRGYGYSGWGRRLIVNRRSKSALGCDPAMSKNRFDASFMYFDKHGSEPCRVEKQQSLTRAMCSRKRFLSSVTPSIYRTVATEFSRSTFLSWGVPVDNKAADGREGGSIPTLVIKRGVVCEKRELDARTSGAVCRWCMRNTAGEGGALRDSCSD
ncbi:hypothetical protein EVAR_38922_1 [Eumeta japonica]|uniref:Uncharacterized protein n=1 Tax=Eumeta variegata TaxID=151549 RepID=A0A4C1ZNG7_EUMVA|nr:hypothetical protein EVAR_38922_1 [Eumeta japonica]